jgi:hypothetical protein
VSYILVPWVLGSNMEMFHYVRWLEFTIDIFFLTDVVINFFTAYKSDIKMVTDLKKISYHYLTTYFIIDFLASFPGFITGEMFKQIYFLKLLRYFNINRFFRQVRFVLEKIKKILRAFDTKALENMMIIVQ